MPSLIILDNRFTGTVLTDFVMILILYIYFLFYLFPFSALKRQTNPNWQAFVFHIDASPSDDELRDLVKQEADPRLHHIPLHPNPVSWHFFFFSFLF